MRIEEAFKLIEQNPEEADFSGEVGLKNISEAEKILGLTFPGSYRSFLHKYGAGDIFGIEIYGIIKNPTTDGEGVPNGIWVTLKFRKDFDLAENYVVISDTGYGPYYVIDAFRTDGEYESPIYLWDAGEIIEKVSDSFGEFLYDVISEQLSEE